MKSKVLETLIVLRAVDKASAGFNKMFNSANKKADAFARKQSDRASKWGARAVNAGTLAAGIGAALYAPTKLAVDFEQSIANVGAVSGATAAQMAALSTAARRQGRETMFTAVQSAEAMQYLAMAGLNAGQTIRSLPGVLNLAAAGNLDLAQTADIATNIMSGFGLKVSDMGRIGDTLTRTFTSSNSTLETIAATMKYTAPIAAEAGLGLEETAAMAGVLANAGIKGQMAGTSLRGMLLRLAGKTKPAAAALQELGIRTVDSQGNLRDLTTVLQEMGVALDNVPSGRKLEIIKTIFETEGTSGAAKLLTFAKDGGLARYAGDIAGKGRNPITAQSVADRRMDTATGKFLKFKSAMQDLGIAVGNTLLPALTDIAERGAIVANRMADWAEKNPELTGTIVKVAAGVGVLAAGFAVVATTISSVATVSGVLVPVLSALGTAAAAAVAAVGFVPIAIGAAIVGSAILMYKYWDNIKAFAIQARDYMLDVGRQIGEALTSGLLTALSGPLAPFAILKKTFDYFMPEGTGKQSTPNGPVSSNVLDGTRKQTRASMARAAAAGVAEAPSVRPQYRGLSSNTRSDGSTINYSPVINLSGGTAADKSSFSEMLRTHKDELVNMMNRADRAKVRVAY